MSASDTALYLCPILKTDWDAYQNWADRVFWYMMSTTEAYVNASSAEQTLNQDGCHSSATYDSEESNLDPTQLLDASVKVNSFCIQGLDNGYTDVDHFPLCKTLLNQGVREWRERSITEITGIDMEVATNLEIWDQQQERFEYECGRDTRYFDRISEKFKQSLERARRDQRSADELGQDRDDQGSADEHTRGNGQEDDFHQGRQEDDWILIRKTDS